MAVIGFTQDPQAPEGAGLFHMDDGRDLYAHDPDMARQAAQPSPELMQAAQGQDMRVAGPGGAPSPDQVSLDQLGKMKFGANQTAEYDARKAAEQPKNAGPVEPPKDVMAPAQAGPEGSTERDRNVSKYLQAQAAQSSAPRKEAWIPKSKAETVESEGLPYNPDDAAIRIKANDQVMEAKAATAEMIRARAVNELVSAKAAQPELLQRAAEAQKQLAAQHSAYVQERSDLDKAIQASNSNSGSASEWFSSKGTVAELAMVLGQAFGAYSATLVGGENWAQKQVQTIMEHDIAAQKEQAKRGVDNAYRRLELRYKDSDQAEAALRLAQGNILANVQSMHASANQAEDVQAAHQEMLAQNQQAMVGQEQKFQNAAYGKHTVKVDIAHQPAGGGGPPDLVALAKKLKAMGFSDEEVKSHLFGGGGGSSTDAVDRKNVATINGQPFEFDDSHAAQRAQEKVPTLSKLIEDGTRAKALLRKSGPLSRAERSELTSLQREMSLGFGPAFTGSTRVNETEIHEGQKVIGDPDNWLKTDLFGATAAGIDTVLENAKAERAGMMEGGVKVSRHLGKNAQGQRERQYKYQTAPSTLQEVE